MITVRFNISEHIFRYSSKASVIQNISLIVGIRIIVSNLERDSILVFRFCIEFYYLCSSSSKKSKLNSMRIN